ncbi:MAG: hypothetical protein M1133_16400 [Armatimonadetes bacterium]|nr:hypothetical protein [Armatimonadota bacterium]
MKRILNINPLILVLVIIIAIALPLWAAQNVVTGQKVGRGGLTVKGGTLTMQTVAGTTTATVTSAGVATLPYVPIVAETTAARTVTSADFGKLIACSYAGATTVTLPDPSASTAGAVFFIAQTVDQNLTVVGGSTADNNKIIADGVLTTDNVAFSTSSHKIGAMMRVTGISATKWLITDASSCAMTVEAAD